MNQASVIVAGRFFVISFRLYFSLTVPTDPPASFNATAINSTAIELTWSQPPTPNGIIVSYNITYNMSEMIDAESGSGSGSSFIVLVSVLVDAEDGNSYLMTGLNVYTVYTFEIFASTGVGPGPSTQVTARTHHTSKSAITCTILNHQ